jgi:hypothetical protein
MLPSNNKDELMLICQTFCVFRWLCIESVFMYLSMAFLFMYDMRIQPRYFAYPFIYYSVSCILWWLIAPVNAWTVRRDS